MLGVEQHYHDTSISFQYPEATIPTDARIDFPMVHSPNRALTSSSLPPVGSDPYLKLKRQMFQDVKLDTKVKLKETVLNATDTMLNFFRRPTINSNALLTSLDTVNLNNFLQNWWFIENQIPIVPFKDMKYTFKKAPCPLTHQHSHILIEDFLLLSPGDNIVCFISKKHEWLQNKASKKIVSIS